MLKNSERHCSSILIGSVVLNSKLFDFVAIELQAAVVAPFNLVLYELLHVLWGSGKTVMHAGTPVRGENSCFPLVLLVLTKTPEITNQVTD